MRSLPVGRLLALVFLVCCGVAGAACSLDLAGIPGLELDASSEGAGPDAADDITIPGDATTDVSGDGGTDATLDVVMTDATLDADAADAVRDGAMDAADAADATADAADAADASSADAADATSADATDAADAAPKFLFACGAGTVPSCSACMGATQDCVYCQADGGVTTLKGVCTLSGVHCNLTVPSGATMCGCAFPDASACPENYQTCHNGLDGITCRTCGEPFTTGDSCHAGGTCQADTTCR